MRLALLFCVLGSATRLLYGWWFEPWEQSPDQQAWEILLRQGDFTYDQLIHYPHEGGTILVSLIAKFFLLFSKFGALTLAAALIDFVSRFIQIRVADHLFGRQMAIVFGIWTVFGTPSLLPWGSINYGLHALSGAFPFIILYLAFRPTQSIRFELLSGLFLGLACWFSYINLVLVPIYFLVRFIGRPKPAQVLLTLAGLLVVTGLHLLVRNYADPGFHLSEFAASSIRGTNFEWSDPEVWKRLVNVFAVLTDGVFAHPHAGVYWTWAPQLYLYWLFVALVSSMLMLWQGVSRRLILAGWGTIFLFLAIYILSPFYHEGPGGNHVSFRHLTYILPLASLFILVGLWQMRWKAGPIGTFLIIGVIGMVLMFRHPKPPENEIMAKATGWVLGAKLGHEPERLAAIVANEHPRDTLLMEGVGWGLSSALFETQDTLDTAETDRRIDRLIGLVGQFPEERIPQVSAGIDLAFGDLVSHELHRPTGKRIRAVLSEKGWMPDPKPQPLNPTDDAPE